MSLEDDDSVLQIVEAGRARLDGRLREAIADGLQAHPEVGELDEVTIDALVQEAAARAGAVLWRLSLAEGAADLYGVSVSDALADPALQAAERLVGVEEDPEPIVYEDGVWSEWNAEADEPAPEDPTAEEPEEYAPEPEPEDAPADEPEPAAPAVVVIAEPLRLDATHMSGIDSLKSGDKDIELRLSDDGLDVLRRSSGAALGRLDWTQIDAISVAPPAKGRRRKRRPRVMEVRIGAGAAFFELTELTPEQVEAEVTPVLVRLRASGWISA